MTSECYESAAFYAGVKIGHVEAGLRTEDINSPFPEELNHRLISQIATFHFCPTSTAAENIMNEGHNGVVAITGNTVIDTLRMTVNKSYENEIFSNFTGDKLILITMHRRENFGDPMREVLRAMKRVAAEYEHVDIVLPMHLNPKIRELVKEENIEMKNFHFIEPLDVVGFHNIMNKSYIILTDSGGIQEEAPSLGKPVLVLRNETERPEGVAAGTLRMVGTNGEKIYQEVIKLLDNENEYNKMSGIINPYGDGYSSERIVNELKQYFNKN